MELNEAYALYANDEVSNKEVFGSALLEYCQALTKNEDLAMDSVVRILENKQLVTNNLKLKVLVYGLSRSSSSSVTRPSTAHLQFGKLSRVLLASCRALPFPSSPTCASPIPPAFRNMDPAPKMRSA